MVDYELYSLVHDKYVSGKHVTKLFSLSAVKKHGKFCKLIHEGDKETTIYKQIPQGEWQIDGEGESRNKVAFKGGFWEIEFNNDEHKHSAYSEIDLSVEFPRKGFVWLPLRLRMNEGDIPTEKNLGGGFEGLSFTNCHHESFKYRSHRVYFNVGKSYYFLGIEGCIHYNAGDSQITDYRIGQDENGYYIDVIIEMETADYSFLY